MFVKGIDLLLKGFKGAQGGLREPKGAQGSLRGPREPKEAQVRAKHTSLEQSSNTLGGLENHILPFISP